MIYGIYPLKDTTIYEDNYDLNTGLDQLLELNKAVNEATSIVYNSRILMKFDLTPFSQSIADGTITNPQYFLRLFVADGQEVPVSYNIEAYPLSQSWEMGVGKFEESPEIHDGATWLYRDNFTDQTKWWSGSATSASFGAGVTGSYTTYPGGGAWYTGSMASQSFEFENADVNMNVTDIVNAWLTGSIDNNGMIIKWPSSLEKGTNALSTLKFFSRESHTIFLPKLEVRWDDSSFVTSSITDTRTTTVTSSAIYTDSLEYPEITQPTFSSNCTVASSSVTETAASQSFTKTELTAFPGSNLTGSIAMFNINNSTFDGYFSGSLNSTGVTGLYCGSAKGYCISNGVPTMYSVWTEVNASITGSFQGEFIGTYDGTISGSANGYYEGALTASAYDGTITTSSIYLNVSTPYVEYYTTSSQDFYVTCSTSIQPLGDGNIIVYMPGLMDYKTDSKIRVALNARDQFPQLTYVTSSVNYEVNYLPETTYYSIYDANSEDTLIPFDEEYTKVSCDTNGNYFNLWMGFQPERYYRFQFKVVRGQQEQYFDNGFYFKIKR